MKKRAKEELVKIAEDIHKGLIYTDRHLRDKSMLSSVFMVLALADNKTMESIKKIKPVLIYEYLDKAGKTSINGEPVFFSARFMPKEEADFVFETIKKFEEAAAIVKDCAIKGSRGG